MKPYDQKQIRVFDLPKKPHPMDPDYSREGIFIYHNCSGCEHGKKPCKEGNSRSCSRPRARDD